MENIDEVLSKLVFTTNDISRCFPKRNNATYFIKHNTENGRIAKIKNGLYALINPATKNIYADKYMLACKIAKDSFITYHSALEFLGMANQIFNKVYVASAERFKDFEFDGTTYKYIRYPLPADKEVIQSTLDVVLTSCEQTLADCIDRIDYAGGTNELLEAMNACKPADANKLLKILRTYGQKTLYQKVGFLFEKFNHLLQLPQSFFDECKHNISKMAIYFMNDLGRGTLNTKWNVISEIRGE